ncbi:hypothetical protein OPT61_g8287 [Boeremia exigua]|uniref:Uncharacterized protein n=1 Tax=Boeremia exigua TaxID=749465 RepID=A0ACC2HZG1_9PLEO|nr:hypothetical protein OPT61_g8287 [Boeremia exigua]
MSDTKFDPKKDIPDQSGRVYFVTGGTNGLGAQSVIHIATQKPAHIFFSGRNPKRAAELIAQIQPHAPATKLTFIACDLSSLVSVQSAAKELLSKTKRLDVLMCNAGIMATPPALSKDGYELQFATNHLGHALLIKLLLPLLSNVASQPESDVRIINLSSVAYQSAPSAGIEFAKLRTENASYGAFYQPNRWMAYASSKLANLLYPIELAARYPNIMSVAVHPGFIKTELHANENFIDRQMVNFMADKWLEKEEGAFNQTWAATTAKSNLQNGAYYTPVGIKTVPTTRQGKDIRLANELWNWTERELQAWM